MDTIFINDLRVETLVGVFKWERVVPQTVHIDLEMAADARVAAASDDLADALDYHAVSGRVRAFAAEAEFQLIETLAERIADLVMQEFSVPWIKVTLHKTWAVTGHRDVGIALERGQRSG